MSEAAPLSDDELRRMHAWWRAANYLSVGQIYLLDNPLLREPLALEHIKPRLLGHWGTTPGLNFIYVHLNRVIKARDLSMIYVAGPGHGGPGLVANTYLEGTYSEIYPHISQDEEGTAAAVQAVLVSGRDSEPCRARDARIDPRGRRARLLAAHAYGAAFDNPDLIVACVVGDGEAETGPLATSWHSNKFLNPRRDGAVLPILHLNGYKIANPDRAGAHQPRRAGEALRRLWLHAATSSKATIRRRCTSSWRRRSTRVFDEIRAFRPAREQRTAARPRWPMIILRTPEGLDRAEGSRRHAGRRHWRSHQVPFAELATNPAHLHCSRTG